MSTSVAELAETRENRAENVRKFVEVALWLLIRGPNNEPGDLEVTLEPRGAIFVILAEPKDQAIRGRLARNGGRGVRAIKDLLSEISDRTKIQFSLEVKGW